MKKAAKREPLVKPVDDVELTKLVMDRKLHSQLAKQVKALKDEIESREREILARISMDAEIQSEAYLVSVDSTSKRNVSWKEEYLAEMIKQGKDPKVAENAILDKTVPTITPKLIILEKT